MRDYFAVFAYFLIQEYIMAHFNIISVNKKK